MLSDVGKLILRVIVGGLMLFHGVAKLRNGISGIEDMVESKGMPGFFAYGVYVGEVLAPLLMMVGWQTRIAAAVFAFNMVVAVLLAHASDIFSLTTHGTWAIELQAFYIFAAVSIALIGPGSLSASRGRGRFD
jgi:putative oxidoreductase